MRVVHIAGTFVPSLAEGISKNVHSLCVAQRAQGLDAELRARPVPLSRLNHRGTLAGGTVRAARMAARARKEEGVDILQVHASVAATAWLPGLDGRPTHEGPAPVLHLWNSLFGRRERLVAARRRDSWAHSAANGPATGRRAFARWPDIVVSSHFQRDQLARLGYGGRVHVVASGVDTTVYRPASSEERRRARDALGLGTGPVVLYFGHTSSWKGADVLAEALASVLPATPHAQALLALTPYGRGQSRVHERLASLAQEGRVHFRGLDHVPTLLASADIAVLPARAAVGTALHPNVLLECMAAGLPVVASRVGSVPEVLDDGRTGLLVHPGDSNHLAQALANIIADDAGRRRMGEAARAATVERYEWSAVARRMRAVYDEMLARPRGRASEAQPIVPRMNAELAGDPPGLEREAMT